VGKGDRRSSTGLVRGGGNWVKRGRNGKGKLDTLEEFSKGCSGKDRVGRRRREIAKEKGVGLRITTGPSSWKKPRGFSSKGGKKKRRTKKTVAPGFRKPTPGGTIGPKRVVPHRNKKGTKQARGNLGKSCKHDPEDHLQKPQLEKS